MPSLSPNLLKITSLMFLGTLLQAAQSGPYLELGVGVGLSDTKETKTATYVFERGYIGSFALGYQADLFRFELEERYKKDSLYSASIGNSESIRADGDLILNSQMFNVYFSGYNNSNLISSIGVGGGISSLKLGDNITNEGIFSMQGMLSVGYKLTQSFIATTKYSYFYLKESDNFEAKGDGSLTFSLRYIF